MFEGFVSLKTLNDLNDSRRIYENINSYLHEELPIFYTRLLSRFVFFGNFARFN